MNSEDLLERSQHFKHFKYLDFTHLFLKLQDESGLKSLICFGRLLQFFLRILDKLISFILVPSQFIKLSVVIFGSSLLQMENQKRKSMEIEEEFVAINEGNGEDIGLELPLGFSIFEFPISRHPNQRNDIRSSLDKGKSKMVVPEKLPTKRPRSISVQNPSSFQASPATPSVQHVVVLSPIAKAPVPIPVTKYTLPSSRPIQFQFTNAPKKKLATSAREDCSGRKFHEECYYDFKALLHLLLLNSPRSCVIDIF